MIIGPNEHCLGNHKGMPYLPEEAKSIRERYILVAAIDIIIIDGV
jgi:hypothetical protein